MLNEVSLSPEVLCEQLNDEAVLLDMRSGLYFGLTRVASVFWLALERGQTPLAAKDELLSRFSVSDERLSIDLEVLLETLAEKKLITVRRAAARPA
jgi:hypothetical protein